MAIRKRRSRRGSSAVAHRAPFLGNHRDGVLDLLVRVHAGEEKPEPRLVLVNGWMQDRLHVDAASEQRLRQADTTHAVADDHGHDRIALRRSGRKAVLARDLEEESTALAEPLDALGLRL